MEESDSSKMELEDRTDLEDDNYSQGHGHNGLDDYDDESDDDDLITTRTRPPRLDRIIVSIHLSVQRGGGGATDGTSIQVLAMVLINSRGEAIAPVLTSLGVPEEYHMQILPRITNAVDEMLADPQHALRRIFSMSVTISDDDMSEAPEVMPPEWETWIEDHELQNHRINPATESSIKALKTACPEVQRDLDSKCSICYELGTDMDLAEMPCSHVYHRRCIETWLRINHTCPICRYQMPT